MSVYIDRKYLLMVAPRLQRFAQKKTDLYNFRCPICGDSEKNKTKSRGYVYRKKNDYFYMCHNCGLSTTFYNFLDKVDSRLIKEYALERYKDGETGNNNYKKPTFDEFKSKPVFKKTKINLESINSLPDGHYAKEYVKGRKIPVEYHKELYFAPDFKKFVESLEIEKEGLKEEDPRLILPFYNENKELVAFQGRALGESKMRYITIKLHEDGHKVFGIDRIDQEKMIYVVEGPIDSLFLENAVATADSNLESITKIYDRSKVTLVYDNEPRNKELVKIIDKSIENHFNVVIWPEMIDSKDINEMVLDGFSPDEIQDIIDKHTFVNLRAKAEFVNWKKV
jgi:transcription elongation factor Elf1